MWRFVVHVGLIYNRYTFVSRGGESKPFLLFVIIKTMKFFKSVRHALRGIFVFALAERNFKLELLGAVAAILLSAFLKISLVEWALVFVAIFLVFAMELINTAIEKTLDIVHPEYSNKVKDIKDLSAGAVLVAALFALILAGLIFLPKII